MIASVYALSGLLVVAGAISILSGVPIVQLEQGWTAVIAGSIVGSAGLLIFVLGLVLRRLGDLHRALERLAAPALAVSAPLARSHAPEPLSESMEELPAVVARSRLDRAVPVSLDEEAPADMPAEPALLDDFEPSTKDRSAEIRRGSSSVVEPSFLARPSSGSMIDDRNTDQLAQPTPPYDLDVFQVRTGAPEATQPDEGDGRTPDEPLWQDLPEPGQSPQREASRSAIPMPTVEMGEALPPSPAAAAPFAQPRRPNILAKLFGRSASTAAPVPAQAEPSADPTVETVLVPLREPGSPAAPTRTSIDLSSGWGESAVYHEPEAVDVTPAETHDPQFAHVEINDLAGPSAPPPHPLRAQPTSESDMEPSILGRYTAGSASYVMYSNGTIEVETETGVHRFASMQELKEFIANQDASAI